MSKKRQPDEDLLQTRLEPARPPSAQKPINDVDDAGGPQKPAESWAAIWRAWPKCTLCILSNEFCERFSYYGMRTVLTLYFLNVLKFSNRSATVCYQSFVIACYFLPLVGSFLADGYIGKFWTIVVLSLLYTLGQVTLAVASALDPALFTHPWLDLAGLAVIALGTGGIKPCVSPFGGDQFEPHQTRMISLFFSAFYFIINCGAMVSSIVSPLFRAHACLGHDSCYPLAFGVPALLMITSTVLFLAGSRWYKKKPPSSNVFKDVFLISKKALSNRRTSFKQHDHWLQYYLDDHDCDRDEQCRALRKRKTNGEQCAKALYVADIRSLLRILVMFLPLPMFFALYDQQGSKWTIQALHMDLRLWGDRLILPDQMLSVNAVLILVCIPLFQAVVFPTAARFVRVTPLRKMVTGGLLTALAFCIAAAVQRTLPDLPDVHSSFVHVVNTVDGCEVIARAEGTDAADAPGTRQLLKLQSGLNPVHLLQNGPACLGTQLPERLDLVLEGGQVYALVLTEQGATLTPVQLKKPTDGNGESAQSFLIALQSMTFVSDLALCRVDSGADVVREPCKQRDAQHFVLIHGFANSSSPLSDATKSEDSDLLQLLPYLRKENRTGSSSAALFRSKSVRSGRWRLYFVGKGPTSEPRFEFAGLELEQRKQGGVCLNVVAGGTDNVRQVRSSTLQLVPDNAVSILWQLPQYVVLTASECLFAITGNEFAYSQAAPSMKALIQALWLMTSAAGNLLIVLMELADLFSDMAWEFLAYALIMSLVMAVFAVQAHFYTYNDFSQRVQDEAEEALQADRAHRTTTET